MNAKNNQPDPSGGAEDGVSKATPETAKEVNARLVREAEERTLRVAEDATARRVRAKNHTGFFGLSARFG
ncbi:hypothetical protein [Phycisphaera mikurensis]|uniref:Uncharacterized protein n=1 Tax=Phycisphaera mikurensis (strain NBRC 102666 / KCTC 22515 / FYK2301M01) TaxID=1142394 RepID=I0IAC9_PHYMF|nr:hypothetical protein [Phycisphaera mikurensis]MBB6441784.1 hypothetical protein [Phycisphaera mikurensis]BAM02217.1 hypothetical protein PSMK_00580 [Phycisphaera mikurensis NBRC 102666]